jgi:hypothetical protein
MSPTELKAPAEHGDTNALLKEVKQLRADNTCLSEELCSVAQQIIEVSGSGRGIATANTCASRRNQFSLLASWPNALMTHLEHSSKSRYGTVSPTRVQP